MPWKEFHSGARMFVPKGKFEHFQAAQFWAGFNGAISGRVAQALRTAPTEPVRIGTQVQLPQDETPTQSV